MTEPASEQQQQHQQHHHHHLKTSADAPSGGSGGASPEHPPTNDRARAEAGGRGRQRDPPPPAKAENGSKTTTTTMTITTNNNNNNDDNNTGDNNNKLWQMRGNPPLPKCPVAAAQQQHRRQGPAARDASGEGTLVAHGNSGDGPLEETSLSQAQGTEDRDPDLRHPGGGRKKHRRRPSKKKRRWKPYFKLSWEEKKALDERETARASRVREEMFAKGLPVAPYNTTQFLMDEHDREEPDLNTCAGSAGTGGGGWSGSGPAAAARRASALGVRPEDTASEEDNPAENNNNNEEDDDDDSCGGSDGIGRPGNAGGGEFLQRDFSETYERYHVETLQNMSKQELVQEYLELEKCMSRLEEENNRLRLLRRTAAEPQQPGCPLLLSPAAADPAAAARLRELERELERLRMQNDELRLQSQPHNKERGPVVTN
ncbi:Protein HEXIM [Merluccius polli]|uniref:Protein HEXIM n=1 Tax=Merluccius polli TaxID=89951 RepID=A0AA47MVV4_MERPO|nr:Protein HEXIM [Merluccius polli]